MAGCGWEAFATFVRLFIFRPAQTFSRWPEDRVAGLRPVVSARVCMYLDRPPDPV
jgi:hypothetical protein